MVGAADARAGGLALLAPPLFVVLWSTGFIGAKLGLPHAAAFTFLGVRFLITAVLMTGIAIATGAPWPGNLRQVGHLAIAGCLINTVYLGGVFAAIGLGITAGTSALIASLQPVLVAAAAGPLLGERVSRLQMLGLGLGVAGCAAVVWPRLGSPEGNALGLALCVLALLGISAGTLYQKRFCQGIDLRSGNAVQFWASAVSTGAVALMVGDLGIDWAPAFVFALAWLVLVLSLGAVTLLYVLIRRGAASRVSALFFMVPPTTALMAWALFDERLLPVQFAGMAVVAVGVALVTSRRPA
ncbi:MAG: DMT family transporter [Geminicoccaceae bacterium]